MISRRGFFNVACAAALAAPAIVRAAWIMPVSALPGRATPPKIIAMPVRLPPPGWSFAIPKHGWPEEFKMYVDGAKTMKGFAEKSKEKTHE